MTSHSESPVLGVAPLRHRFDARRPRVRAGALILVVLLLALGFGIWLATRSEGSAATSPVPRYAEAAAISASELKTLAAAIGQPIYWAGPQQNVRYELTRAEDGRIWIRYLPPGAKIGERAEPYLTIGTYPMRNAFAATQAIASRRGSTRINVGPGAVAFYTAAHPTSVYVAYRASDYQIELFDPSAEQARQFVASGQIRLAPGSNSATTGAGGSAVALDAAGLKARTAAAASPVYWAGPQQNVSYELTQTSNGRTYVRYLPTGVKAGSKTRYLTIGTYPLQNALAATKAAAKGSGAVAIDVGHGGFGFYSRSSPSSVYLAYPGENVQMEVFDPSPREAQQVASSGRLRPVR
jgi:hypothetical protein